MFFFFSFIFNLFSFDSVDSVQQSPRRNEWSLKASAFSGLVGKVPVRWPHGFKGLGRMGSWVAVSAWEGRSACACVLVARMDVLRVGVCSFYGCGCVDMFGNVYTCG